MNLLDMIIIVIVGTAFVMSLFRGLVKEVFSLGSIILGFLIANRTYDYVGEFLTGYVHHAPVAKMFGYLFVFVGTSIAIRLAGTLLEKLVKKVMLGWADHLIGALFGFLKGCLIVSVIIMLMASFMPGSRILQESRLTPYILSTVGLMAKVSPKEIKKRFAGTRKELEKLWEKNRAALHLPDPQGEIIGKLIRGEKK